MKHRFLLFCLLVAQTALGQTPHSSQFYSTPLSVNPAFTGFIDGPYRVSTNYRSQWGGSQNPYITITASGDVQIKNRHISEENRLGAGLVLLSDKTMGGAVQTNTISVSTAYNIALDENRVHNFGLGFQGYYTERRIDFGKLSFENQFGGSGFDPSLPIGEDLQNGKRHFLDLNIGAAYHYFYDDKAFFGGLAVGNILQKSEKFISEDFKAPRKLSLMGGGQMDAGYNGVIFFSAHYQNSGQAQETTLGAAYGYKIGTEKKQILNIGAWHRINDALIPYLGYQLNGFQAGFSYDYTVSKLKTAGQVRNGFEFSLVYTGEDKSELRRLIPWY